MEGLDVSVKNLSLNKNQVIYLEKLLEEVRKLGDIELIYALEKQLIDNGNLLPRRNHPPGNTVYK